MIRLIILIILAVIILGYFGFSVENIINSPQVATNLEYIKNIGLDIFHWIVSHIKEFVTDSSASINEGLPTVN